MYYIVHENDGKCKQRPILLCDKAMGSSRITSCIHFEQENLEKLRVPFFL